MSVQYNPGLEGVTVARTEISHVDGKNGRLVYRGGHVIEEIATRSYEEIIHLLWFGSFPSSEELVAFRQQLAERRHLNEGALAALHGLPRGVNPMDGLRTVLSAQGAQPGVGRPSIEDAISITAVVPTIVAACFRRAQGQPLVDPRADLGHAENLLYMLTSQEPETARASWLQSYLVLIAEHALNPSTFTARIVGSAGSDLWSAVVAAIGTLKGPSHGGATPAAAEMIEAARQAPSISTFVRARLERGERLMGFGHREYRRYDPRAAILRDLCKSANPEFYETAVALEETALNELLRRHPDRPNFTNVDYFAGGVLAGVGIPADYFTCFFAAGRVAGWTAHVLEYVGQDGRIVSPASEWAGPALSPVE
ncbi:MULTISPECIES: citrate/2-methylcitrate synthase [Streptomyces]|uniref:Citrate synthase n=1 Tax=Streptomyces lonegramiae TaxID=3075524 RepID=A0ABU2XEM8_9ACTN|nr:citrate/2-methylcitrate synthase [Streptomyces sp. DSM 41529]MDT0543956.1 citrate/2-methylcitrate synthase [Streptomyces sp. DSM 41529]